MTEMNGLSARHGELLTVDAVATFAHVTKFTVRRWIVGGKLRAIRPGRGYRIYEADLTKFLESCAFTSPGAGEK